ncbi:hypothetical protein KBA41_13925 [Candidatus Ozemobacteraceae bacterium]|nr:hypothetical protein [Candidatus Ozemobacteraceae bacterium]
MRSFLRGAKHVVSVLAVLLFAAVAGPVCGAEGGWATIDARLLLAIHPNMACFDYSHDRFFRNDASSQNAAALGQTLQAAWNKTQPKLRELGKKLDKINQAKFDILQKREATIRSLMENEANKRGQMRDRAKQIGEYEAQYSKSLAECDSQIAQLAREIENTQEEAYSPVYLTKSETAMRFESMKKEIESLIEQTARENRIGVVLDTSFGRSSQQHSPKPTTIPRYPEPSDTLASKLFHTFSNWTPSQVPATTVPGPNGKPIPAKDHVAFAAGQNMVQTLERYLEFKPYLTTTAARFSSGNIFLTGGMDLTPVVAKKIFTRYRIPVEIQNSFQLLIQKYGQFDRTSGM